MADGVESIGLNRVATIAARRAVFIAAVLLACSRPGMAMAQEAEPQGESAAPAAEAPPAESPDEEESNDGRLFEQEPYDEVVLNDAANTVIRVLPLEARRVPEQPKSSDKLVVRRVEDAEQEFEIRWGAIKEVRFFERMVLAEARGLVASGKFDAAYDYYDFLQVNYPQTDGLLAGQGEFLFEDAKNWQRKGRYENALALLNELHALDPQHANVAKGLGAATDKLVEQYVGAGNLLAARRLIQRLAAKVPDHEIALKWRDQWTQLAQQQMDAGQMLLADGKYREAQETGRQVFTIWPELPGAVEFMEQVYEKYPRIVVGVTSPAGEPGGPPLVDWAARRTTRLLSRQLAEFIGVGPEGGLYACPLGQLEKAEVGRRLVFKLKRGIRWSASGETLTGFHLARQLQMLADPSSVRALADWSDVFRAVEVRDVYEVTVDLKWSHVRPEALLQTPILGPQAPAGEGESAAPAGVGGFHVLDRSAEQVRFAANGDYFAAGPKQPKEIVELLADPKQALSALTTGRIQVLDRISPWEVERFAADPELVVGAYALPTLCCLLPNRDRPFTGNRNFRRALLYGVNRELILNRHVLRDTKRPGSQVVSGPFPAGVGFDDPLRYAYNSEVAPRPYDPQLAIALIGVAVHEVAAAAEARGEPPVKAAPTLVLAYPPRELARATCQAIQKHLQAVKLTIELRELPPGQTPSPNGDFDLLYTEVVMQEPLVEARRLLAGEGLAGGANPYLNLALRRLDAADGWNTAHRLLQDIHRLAADDVTVLPLWQIVEHFVYHRSIQGIGKGPVLLYQNVEQWQTRFQLPTEEKEAP